MATETLRSVDQNGLKVGQALTILLLIVAYILNNVWLVAFVALAQLLGALDASFAPYRLAYRYLVKPTGLVNPNPVKDNPEPHRFSMLVGAIFNGAATLALFFNASWIGWGLVGIVIVLANLNFWLNFCAGCWMYYQFHKLGIPGFVHAPLNK
jgi:hypothetical protein